MRFLTGARSSWLIDCAAIFLAAAFLVFPLFQLEYGNSWASIESTFISDGRFLAENWPSPRWQPNWYAGTRFDYIYPPAIRYGTAGLSRWLGVSTARSYHLYTAILYCVGIVAVYLLVRVGSRERRAALLGAAAAALVSPTYLFDSAVYGDVSGARLLPHRLNVLVRYGEGPHMSAMALLPIALAAAFVGLRRGRPAALAVSAIFSALVVANNFYGATALAIFFPVMVWAVWITTRDHVVPARAAAIALLAFGLNAFWLTPSYLTVTLRNMKQVSKPGNAWSVAVAIVVIAVFAWITWRRARGRETAAWSVFVWGALTLMGLNVLGQYYFNFRVMGEPLRLYPELDIAFILAALEVLRRLWIWRPPRGPAWLPRAVVVVLILAAFFPSRKYGRHPWIYYEEDPNPRARIEASITDWIAKNMPGTRAMATGSVRFWYNAWRDLPQIGGGSEQGLLNEAVVPAYYQATGNDDPWAGILWLQAMGTGALIVHDRTSEEIYHDFVKPEKFRGVLKAVYEDGKGNWIYEIPRRFPGLARVVVRDKIRAHPELGVYTEMPHLRSYTEIVEKGPDVEPVYRRGSIHEISVRVRTAEGQSVLVQETYDPSWTAYSGSMQLRTDPDPAGFILIDTPPGEHEIRLSFTLPAENFLGRLATGATFAAIALLMAGVTPRRFSGVWANARARTALGAASIFAVNAVLNAFLFLPGELPYRDSVEAGYASAARFISEYSNPWGWNPTQYGGLPTQFAYLPALNYATAFLSWILPGGDVPYVYRLLTTILTCFGPVAVFLFVRYFSRHRGWAFAAAMAYTLFSPSYYFFWQLFRDRGFAQLPWRWHVRLKYGEGPHNVGLALLPLALVALWWAATGGRFRRVFAAAILLATIALTNWIAAMALAWSCLALLLAGIGTRRETGFRAARALGAAGLAYLLACFWLTPSFIATTAFNWPKDAFEYRLGPQQTLLFAGLLAGALLLRLLFLRAPQHSYVCFLLIALFGFAYVAVGFYRYHVDTLPESRRYILEAEMFLFILLFELLRRAMAHNSIWLRGSALGLFFFCLSQGAGQAVRYAGEPFARLRPFDVELTPEWRVSQFLKERDPKGRVFVSGGTRYRLNSWHDIPQLGGTFETGLRNRVPLDVIYQVRTGLGLAPGAEGRGSLLLLKPMGVEYVVVHGPESKEHYRDYKFPAQFEGVAERVYQRDGDRIYKLPFRSYAHLVRREELPEVVPVGLQYEAMTRYVRAMEDSARPPLAARWRGASEMEIEGRIPEGMLVWVQVSHDPGWAASQDGAPVAVDRDVTGFLLIGAKPAERSRILLRFRATAETRLFGVLSALAWIGAIAVAAREWRRERAR
jgi:hypothetical protein